MHGRCRQWTANVLVVAPTGKTAHVVEAATLHSEVRQPSLWTPCCLCDLQAPRAMNFDRVSRVHHVGQAMCGCVEHITASAEDVATVRRRALHRHCPSFPTHARQSLLDPREGQ